MASRASDAEHHRFLSRVWVNETVVARKTHRQRIGILLRHGVWNKTKALQVRIFSERRRSSNRKTWLLERQEPGIRQQLAALRRVVITMALLVRPVLCQPRNIFGTIDPRHFQAVVYAEKY